MPKFFNIFFRSFLILAGVFFLGALLASLWDVFNTQWFPEQILPAIILTTFLGMGGYFPALFLSSLTLTFSYSVRSADFIKDAQGGIDSLKNIRFFSYIAMVGGVIVLVFQFVAGPLINQSLERFHGDYRIVSELEATLRGAHEEGVERYDREIIKYTGEFKSLVDQKDALELKIQKMKEESKDKGVPIPKAQIDADSKALAQLKNQIVDKRRYRPTEQNTGDWKDNFLISYETNNKNALTFEKQLTINQNILLFRPSDERAMEAAGLLQKAISSEAVYKNFHFSNPEIVTKNQEFKNPEELIISAEAALASDDFFTANELAYQAYRIYHIPTVRNLVIPPELEARAVKVLTDSYTAFSQNQETLKDKAAAEYFRVLQTALENYTNGEFTNAYYMLKELSRKQPLDKEVQKFLTLSEAEVVKSVVFTDEAEEAFQLLGSGVLLFLNPLPQKDIREMVCVQNMVATTRGAFLKNIEVTRWNREGKVVLHFTAPFGLLNNGFLNLNFRDREVRTPVFTLDKEIPLQYPMRVSLQDLDYLARRSEPITFLSIYDLFSQVERLPDLGYGTRLVESLLIVRVMEAFFVFGLAFFLFWVSWFFRSRHMTQAPAGLSFLSVLLPLVVLVVYQILLWIFSLFTGFMLTYLGSSYGFITTLLFSMGVAGGFIIVNLIILRQVLK